MHTVQVTIVKIQDTSSYPTIVEFELTDVGGEKHCFIDKLPVVSDQDDLKLPMIGNMRCSVRWRKENTCLIDTEFPDDIESLAGKYQFEVDASLVSAI